jgi:3-phosphoglycerate kinase
MRSLRSTELAGKTVLYRPDYNVPLEGAVIRDTYRISATYPTLEYLMEHGARIVIVSHLGRPDGKVVPELSLRPIAEHLASRYPQHTVRMAHELFHEETTAAIESMKDGDILILPNIRFYPEEEENDQAFARKVAALADLYVNDAFACSHRAHASVAAVAAELPSYPGFLMEEELHRLGSLTANPEHPFVVVMGGAKVSDKIGVIEKLAPLADVVLIGGAMANTFRLAKGEDISASKAETDKVELAQKLLSTFGDKLVIAPDGVAKQNDDGTFSYLDIGERTVAAFTETIASAAMVFWNGSLGYTEEAPYDAGSTAVLRALAARSESGATTIVAGGDTVELVTRLGLHDSLTFVSTGGGAALEFLAGDVLPGVVGLQ